MADAAAAAAASPAPAAPAPAEAPEAQMAEAATVEPDTAPAGPGFVFPVYVGHRRWLPPDAALFETYNEERGEAGKQVPGSCGAQGCGPEGGGEPVG